ncbi:unnamed protein product [Calypogeia fissa]
MFFSVSYVVDQNELQDDSGTKAEEENRLSEPICGDLQTDFRRRSRYRVFIVEKRIGSFILRFEFRFLFRRRSARISSRLSFCRREGIESFIWIFGYIFDGVLQDLARGVESQLR